MIPSKVQVLGFVFSAFIIFFSTTHLFAESSLEISIDGRINANSIFHLKPQNAPPSNPTDGDIYYTTEKKLLIFSDGEWNKIKITPYEWEIGAWGPTIMEANVCTRSRSLICKHVSDGQAVADTYCGPKPADTQPCNPQGYQCRYTSTTGNLYSWMHFGDSTTFSWGESLTTDAIPGKITTYTSGGYKYTRGELVISGPLYGKTLSAYKICRELQ